MNTLRPSIIGYHRTGPRAGQPIYLVAGGSDDGPLDTPLPDDVPADDGGGTAEDAGTDEAAPDEADDEVGGDEQAAGDPADDDAGDGDMARLPGWARRQIRDARRGEADRRTQVRKLEAQIAEQSSKQEQLLEGVARLFGLAGDDTDDEPETPTPDKLMADLQAAQEQNSRVQQDFRQARIELAVYRAAGEYGGDPDALLDSRAFLTGVVGLDPTDERFVDAVGDAIDRAVKANPKLRAEQPKPAAAPAPSGGQFSGGPAGRTDLEALSVEDFRQRRRAHNGVSASRS